MSVISYEERPQSTYEVVKVILKPNRISITFQIFVLCSVILTRRFFSYELSTIYIVVLGIFVMTFGRIPRSFFKIVWPLLGVLIIGCIGVFDQKSRDILRDIAFSLGPICLIYIGYWLASNKRMWPFIMKVMVVLGLVFAIYHLQIFISNPMLLTSSVGYIRYVVGAGSGNLVVIALVVGLFQNRFRIAGLFPKLLLRFVVMPLLFISFVLSYSRTGWVVAIVLCLALLGTLSRINRRFIFTIVMSMAVCIAIAVVSPKGEEGTFLSKIKDSFTEITISDYRNMEDINSNWRGFETHSAVNAFLSGSILQKIFGQGFGALVDLGFYMPLGGTELRYIPITHNGYVYILIKTGLLGLFLYILFYIYVIKFAIRHCQSTNNERQIWARLLLGSILSLIASMYVVGGMAEMHDVEFVLLIGYLMRKIRQSLRDKSPCMIGRIALGGENHSSMNSFCPE